jgi:hypothetical protein
MINVKRTALNEVIRQVGSGTSFASNDSVSDSIKNTWDELYTMYYRMTGLDIKTEADNGGYHSALDYVERVGCLEKLCLIANNMYRGDYTTLVGKVKALEILHSLRA